MSKSRRSAGRREGTLQTGGVSSSTTEGQIVRPLGTVSWSSAAHELSIGLSKPHTKARAENSYRSSVRRSPTVESREKEAEDHASQEESEISETETECSQSEEDWDEDQDRVAEEETDHDRDDVYRSEYEPASPEDEDGGTERQNPDEGEAILITGRQADDLTDEELANLLEDGWECGICCETLPKAVLWPCLHEICVECQKRVQACPMCRRCIRSVKRLSHSSPG